jgi:hypothetical protein
MTRITPPSSSGILDSSEGKTRLSSSDQVATARGEEGGDTDVQAE